MTFADTVRFLFSLGPELKTVKWDLERIHALLAALGAPHRTGRFIHVAGTNGKGSVCAMLESALRTAGYRTGLYTSPHLTSPRERIQIAGAPVSEDAWVSAFQSVHEAAEQLLARGAVDAHPSFFETITAMAFLLFAQAGVDIVVLETGLGGRLDATNVVEPELSVITQIDFDHEAFLGSSIEAIAAEKAGILKRGRPAVFSVQRPEALAVLEHRALALDVPVRQSASLRVAEVEMDRYGSRFTVADDEAFEIICPLPGEHQIENARTAIAALRVFGVEAPAIRQGIANARWPGRLEFISRQPATILDGAHNPAGAAALARYIRRFFSDEPIRIVYAAMRDKAIEEVTSQLFPLAAEVIVTAVDQPRALSPQAVLDMVDHPAIRTSPDVRSAIEAVRRSPMPTFITGSLFLVGEARELLSAA